MRHLLAPEAAGPRQASKGKSPAGRSSALLGVCRQKSPVSVAQHTMLNLLWVQRAMPCFFSHTHAGNAPSTPFGNRNSFGSTACGSTLPFAACIAAGADQWCPSSVETVIASWPWGDPDQSRNTISSRPSGSRSIPIGLQYTREHAQGQPAVATTSRGQSAKHFRHRSGC